MKNILLTIFGISLLLFTGCDYFENSDTLDSATIEINISGLPAISDTMTYVAWVENEDTSQIKPTIIFAADAVDGNLYYKSEAPLRLIQAAQIFWLSVERDSVIYDSVFTPSNRRILGGRFSLGGCNLAIGEKALTFDDYSVTFNLLTPTDGPNLNETSGVWFVEIDTAGVFSTGLNIPELYGGWIYEGWVEVNGQYLSTGRFESFVGADLSKLYGESGTGMPYPGEDFLTNAPQGITFPLDLSGKIVYISAEVNDGRNYGEAPYIILFEATIPVNPETRVAYEMVNVVSNLPFGNAVIKVDLVK
ncbi:MAG: hypothetical protein MUO34_10035 [Ignavibacteriaceae bacterium]|nr:hypothetical protein [Ignavibacteriaceae bacterium]